MSKYTDRTPRFPFYSPEYVASLLLSYVSSRELLLTMRLVNKTFYFASEIAPYWWTKVNILKSVSYYHFLGAQNIHLSDDQRAQCCYCRGVWSLHFKLLTGGVIPLGNVCRQPSICDRNEGELPSQSCTDASLDSCCDEESEEREERGRRLSTTSIQSLSNENCAPALNGCSAAAVDNRHEPREETTDDHSTVIDATCTNKCDYFPLLKLSLKSTDFGFIKHLRVGNPLCGVGCFFRNLLTGGAILLESIVIHRHENVTGDWSGTIPSARLKQINRLLGGEPVRVCQAKAIQPTNVVRKNGQSTYRQLKGEQTRGKYHRVRKNISCPVQCLSSSSRDPSRFSHSGYSTRYDSDSAKRSGTYAMENDRACEDSNSVEAADGRKCSRYPYLTNKGYTRATGAHRLKFVKCLIIDVGVGPLDLLQTAYCLCGEDLLKFIRTSAEANNEVSDCPSSKTAVALGDADKRPVLMSEGLRLEVLLLSCVHCAILKLPIVLFQDDLGAISRAPHALFDSWRRKKFTYLDFSAFDILCLIVACCPRNTIRIFGAREKNGQAPTWRMFCPIMSIPTHCNHFSTSEGSCNRTASASASDSFNTSEGWQGSHPCLDAATYDSMTQHLHQHAAIKYVRDEVVHEDSGLLSNSPSSQTQSSHGAEVSTPLSITSLKQFLNTPRELILFINRLQRDLDKLRRGRKIKDPVVLEKISVLTEVATACVLVVNRVRRIPNAQGAPDQAEKRLTLWKASTYLEMMDIVVERHLPSLNSLSVLNANQKMERFTALISQRRSSNRTSHHYQAASNG